MNRDPFPLSYNVDVLRGIQGRPELTELPTDRDIEIPVMPRKEQQYPCYAVQQFPDLTDSGELPIPPAELARNPIPSIQEMEAHKKLDATIDAIKRQEYLQSVMRNKPEAINDVVREYYQEKVDAERKRREEALFKTNPNADAGEVADMMAFNERQARQNPVAQQFHARNNGEDEALRELFAGLGVAPEAEEAMAGAVGVPDLPEVALAPLQLRRERENPTGFAMLTRAEQIMRTAMHDQIRDVMTPDEMATIMEMPQGAVEALANAPTGDEMNYQEYDGGLNARQEQTFYGYNGAEPELLDDERLVVSAREQNTPADVLARRNRQAILDEQLNPQVRDRLAVVEEAEMDAIVPRTNINGEELAQLIPTTSPETMNRRELVAYIDRQFVGDRAEGDINFPTQTDLIRFAVENEIIQSPPTKRGFILGGLNTRELRAIANEVQSQALQVLELGEGDVAQVMVAPQQSNQNVVAIAKKGRRRRIVNEDPTPANAGGVRPEFMSPSPARRRRGRPRVERDPEGVRITREDLRRAGFTPPRRGRISNKMIRDYLAKTGR